MTNFGLSDAEDVRVTDDLPAGVAFVSASSSKGTCTEPPQPDGTISCDLGALNPDGDPVVRVRATEPGEVVNRATVASPTEDVRPQDVAGNNTDTATTQIEAAQEPQPNNRPPTAKDDARSTAQNKPVNIAVLGNDSDPDGDRVRITDFDQPGHGMVRKSGDILTYSPDRDFTGRDAFTYAISDGKGGKDTARVIITVRRTRKRGPDHRVGHGQRPPPRYL